VLRKLVSSFLPWRLRFVSKAVSARFVVERMTLGQLFSQVLQFFLVSIIPPLLCIHSYIIWRLNNGPVSDCSSTEIVSLLCNSNKSVRVWMGYIGKVAKANGELEGC
jgi:hypothetical protein